MKQIVYLFKKIFSIMFFLGIFFPLQTFAVLNPPTQEEIIKAVEKPTQRIKIPGLEYSSLKTVDQGGSTYIYIPYIGEYLSVMYRYVIIVAAVICVIMIIVSGMQWTASGGNSSTIDSAKKRISNAIIGLILSVGSYTILYTINPELIAFRSLKIRYVQGIDMAEFNEKVTSESIPTNLTPMQIVQGAGETPIDGKGGTGITYGFNGIPYFSQFDSRWGKLRYGTREDCTSFTQSACGPTSIAMILRYLGKDVNPTNVAAIATQTGARNCNDGTNSSNEEFQKALKKNYDINISVFTSPDEALNILRNKKHPLLISSASEGYGMNGAYKKYDGHFMVVTGVDTILLSGKKTEVVRINDPGNRPGFGITYMTMDQFKKKNRFLYFTKTTQIPEALDPGNPLRPL